MRVSVSVSVSVSISVSMERLSIDTETELFTQQSLCLFMGSVQLVQSGRSGRFVWSLALALEHNDNDLPFDCWRVSD